METALIIVDIQNDYFPGGRMELAGMAEAAGRARQAIERFRAEKRPIFHVQHISNRAGAAFFLPETDGVEIHSSVTPRAGEPVIQKNFPNAFKNTVLSEQLRRLDVKTVVFCGAMTHMCIDTSVRAAFDLGFRCIVLSDACAAKSLEFGGVAIEAAKVHAAFMAALSSPFAKVITVDLLESHLA